MTIEAQHQYATTLQLQRKFTDAEPLQQEVLKVAEGKFKDQIVSGTIVFISTNDATVPAKVFCQWFQKLPADPNQFPRGF